MTILERTALHQAIDNLPEYALTELAGFVEFLQFKTHRNVPKRSKVTGKTVSNSPTTVTPYKPVFFPRGILKEFDLSPEQIAEARKELWRGFGGSFE